MKSEYIISVMKKQLLESDKFSTNELLKLVSNERYSIPNTVEFLLAANIACEIIKNDLTFKKRFDAVKNGTIVEKMTSLVCFAFDKSSIEPDSEGELDRKILEEKLDMKSFKQLSISVGLAKSIYCSRDTLCLTKDMVEYLDEIILAGACLYLELPYLSLEILTAYEDVLNTALSLQALTLGADDKMYAELCRCALINNCSVKDLIQKLDQKYNDFALTEDIETVVMTDVNCECCVIMKHESVGMSTSIVVSSVVLEGLLRRKCMQTIIITESSPAVCTHNGVTKTIQEIFGLTPSKENLNYLYN